MASSFAPTVQPGGPQPRVVNYTVDPAATFPKNQLVYLDTADNLIKQCGADPSLILGLAASSAADAIAGNSGLPAGQIAVSIIEPTQVWIMGSATTPAESHLTDGYGVVNTSNQWLVDTAETDAGDIVVNVVDYSPKTGQVGKECFFVKFPATKLQLDAIAS